MVLADSVEPLHYPAIMFSSPSAPRLPGLPRRPLHPRTRCHQNPHTQPPPPSIILLLLPFPYPSLPSPGYLPPSPPRAAIHRCRFILQLPPCLFYSLFVTVCLFLSPSISLTSFHWSYYFFTVSCLLHSSCLPSFVNLLWFIGFTAVTFWKKLYGRNTTSFENLGNNILCI